MAMSVRSILAVLAITLVGVTATTCVRKVGSCRLPPHQCLTFFHGESVFCSADHECLCGEGTCKADDSNVCVPEQATATTTATTTTATTTDTTTITTATTT